MEFSTEIQFESDPAVVRQAIMTYVTGKYPKAADYITWDSTGTRASGSKLGASGLVLLSGDGPTIVRIQAKIGFPASMAVSRGEVERYLDQAVRDLKQSTP